MTTLPKILVTPRNDYEVPKFKIWFMRGIWAPYSEADEPVRGAQRIALLHDSLRFPRSPRVSPGLPFLQRGVRFIRAAAFPFRCALTPPPPSPPPRIGLDAARARRCNTVSKCLRGLKEFLTGVWRDCWRFK